MNQTRMNGVNRRNEMSTASMPRKIDSRMWSLFLRWKTLSISANKWNYLRFEFWSKDAVWMQSSVSHCCFMLLRKTHLSCSFFCFQIAKRALQVHKSIKRNPKRLPLNKFAMYRDCIGLPTFYTVALVS